MADSKYEEERRDEAALRELLRRDFAARSAAVTGPVAGSWWA